jgi:hypothetical protein
MLKGKIKIGKYPGVLFTEIQDLHGEIVRVDVENDGSRTHQQDSERAESSSGQSALAWLKGSIGAVLPIGAQILANEQSSLTPRWRSS